MVDDADLPAACTQPVGLPYGQGTRMLTAQQVSEWFAVPEKTVRGLVDRRTIPFRKIGQALRFPEAELEEWSRPKPKPGAGTTIPLRLPPITPAARRGRGQGRTLNVSYDS